MAMRESFSDFQLFGSERPVFCLFQKLLAQKNLDYRGGKALT
jgi:hypothetical protein